LDFPAWPCLRCGLKQAALADRWRPLAQITPGDLDVAILGKLPATQLALYDHLEPGTLEMKSLHAPLRCRALIEQPLEDAPANPRSALVGSEQHGELNAIAVVVPARVLGKLEKTALRPPGKKGRMFVVCSVEAKCATCDKLFLNDGT
jgi:hypothetical protein